MPPANRPRPRRNNAPPDPLPVPPEPSPAVPEPDALACIDEQRRAARDFGAAEAPGIERALRLGIETIKALRAMVSSWYHLNWPDPEQLAGFAREAARFVSLAEELNRTPGDVLLEMRALRPDDREATLLGVSAPTPLHAAGYASRMYLNVGNVALAQLKHNTEAAHWLSRLWREWRASGPALPAFGDDGERTLPVTGQTLLGDPFALEAEARRLNQLLHNDLARLSPGPRPTADPVAEAGAAPTSGNAPKGWVTVRDLTAGLSGRDAAALKKALERFRRGRNSWGAWHEVANPEHGEPRFLFALDKISHIVNRYRDNRDTMSR